MIYFQPWSLTSQLSWEIASFIEGTAYISRYWEIFKAGSRNSRSMQRINWFLSWNRLLEHADCSVPFSNDPNDRNSTKHFFRTFENRRHRCAVVGIPTMHCPFRNSCCWWKFFCRKKWTKESMTSESRWKALHLLIHFTVQGHFHQWLRVGFFSHR